MKPLDQVKAEAMEVAGAMRSAGQGPLPKELRSRFIGVRSELFQRGIYDPVLVRFDSATVQQIPAAEAAEQLASVVAAL
jgi:hypothetical protein